MVGPSTSVSETGIPRKKVDFSISPHAEETIKGISQGDIPITDLSVMRIEDKASTVPRSTATVVSTVDSSPQKENLGYEERGQTHDLMTLEVRDMDTRPWNVMSIMESILIFNCLYPIDHI